jgi:intracellular multiplication protein IcmL
MPILVTYQSASEQTQTPYIINMVITRVPTANMPRGIAIASFVSSVGQIAI